MTIRHTSRRVVAPTCRPIAKVVQSSDPQAAVSTACRCLPQAGGSEVVIQFQSTVLRDMVPAQALATFANQ